MRLQERPRRVRFTRARISLPLALAAVSLLLPPPAIALGQGALVTQLQFDIVGIRLVVDPSTLTVPKNTPTIVNVSLKGPDNTGFEVASAVSTLTAGATVEALLSGPSIPTTKISVQPGQPIPIPPFALSGDYFLDQIKLVKDGRTILDGTPSVVPIKVIDQVFVTSVVTRPLTLDEIKAKGIVIDKSSFQVLNFTLALNVGGKPFTIDMPVAFPSNGGFQKDRLKGVQDLLVGINAQLAQTVKLPPELERPGLNFTLASIPFFPVLDDDSDPKFFGIPPITGLIVIPGNVAFLNQFFSVILMVTNVAPDGTPLVLRDVQGTIKLPVGLDGVAGTPESPGDDPLRLARTASGGIQPQVFVVQSGPDGKLGTADDIPTIPPQHSGQGEFLLEGLREGAQSFDMQIDAVLDGLPSGPLRLSGKAAGAVLVRNPEFFITLSHPRTVRSGEPYQLYATVTNTSANTPANLVSVSLDRRAVSGAQLVSDETVTFPTLMPGDSATATFNLIAQKTGSVDYSSFTSDNGLSGDFHLRTGVDERGVPLAPNAIVLPDAAASLPGALIAAAQRVLGQAFSISTSPPAGLPPNVTFIGQHTVIARGIALAEAGQRIQLGEPLSRVAEDLLLDWIGDRDPSEGFDQLLRVTNAGAAFLAEIAKAIGPAVQTSGVLDYQKAFEDAAVTRGAHISAITGGGGGPSPVELSITDASGRGVGAADDEGSSSLPFLQLLALDDAGGRSDFAIIGRPEATQYVVEARGIAEGLFDLGVTVPAGAGHATQLLFRSVPISPGGVARLTIDMGEPAVSMLMLDRNGDGAIDATLAPTSTATIAAGPPQVVAVKQLSELSDENGDESVFAINGLILAVLFDRPVTAESSESPSNYSIAHNAVAGSTLQPSGRLAYLFLQKGVGQFFPRTITIQNIVDELGNELPQVIKPINMVLSDGGSVFGQALKADGHVVPGALITLSSCDIPQANTIDSCTPLSQFNADANGGFDFDYVSRQGDHFLLEAQDPITKETASRNARIRGPGERMLLNLTFIGKGTVRGRVLSDDASTPVPGVVVVLQPSPVFDVSDVQRLNISTHANALGEYVFTNVPVGNYSVSSIDSRGFFGRAAGVLPVAGQQAVTDVVLSLTPDRIGTLTGRVFQSDGVTPLQGAAVYVGQASERDLFNAFAQTTTDAAGSFTIESLDASVGSVDVVAIAPGTLQVGRTRGILVVSGHTVSTVVILEATGSVEGVVRNAQGLVVPGAVVAGGFTLGTADVNGFFHIDGVPAGNRLIEAGDPVTKRRGRVTLTVLPGQTVNVAITLEARATIVGRVFDANRQPVPGVTVRIPANGGFFFVFANNSGFFRFPDLNLDEYLIEAPGPEKGALIDFMKEQGIDPSSAFTAGDAPPDLVHGPPQTDDEIIAAYQQAVETFVGLNDPLINGPPPTPAGGFGFNKVKLLQDSSTVSADITYLPQGTVSGTTVQADGLHTGALVRVLGLTVDHKGSPTVDELKRMNTDPQTGIFSFSGIPRFDLLTFQAAGIRAGDFTLQATTPFSPTIVQFDGQLNPNNLDQSGIILRFPSTAETNGTISGRVLMPDGVTPAPAGTAVSISFGDLTVTTDADGRFKSTLPIPGKSTYAVSAVEPVSGLHGRTLALVPAGGNVDVTIRLLGIGSVVVTAERLTGELVTHANIHLTSGVFGSVDLSGVTDGSGSVRFVNVQEGPFAVLLEEQITGLMGRASGNAVRDHEVDIVVFVTPSGSVLGTFVQVDGTSAVANAQVLLETKQGLRAYGTTSAEGQFEFPAIPIGDFTVTANDPVNGRVGRATGTIHFESDIQRVTVVELARGTVEGLVLQADGFDRVPGSAITITPSTAFGGTSIQATALPDGSFSFEGVAIGDFALSATDPLSGFSGRASGTLTHEGESVRQNVLLDPFATITATVVGSDGALITNAEVVLSGGPAFAARTAVVDTNGQFRFDLVPLGDYSLQAHSLTSGQEHNGGSATVSLTKTNQAGELTIRLRGTGSVTATVVAADGVTRVASSQVTLNAKNSVGSAGPGGFGGTFVAFTDASGLARFEGIPVGDFFVKAEFAAVAGISTGQVAVPDQSVPISIQLGPSGAIRGRILLPNGSTAAAQTFVTLKFPPQSSLQSGSVQVTTDLSGTFEFSGIPLGAFSLSAFEVVSKGVRSASGTLATNGQVVDLGDLVLDNLSPRVTQMSPSPGAIGVAAASIVTLTFSEPMQSTTFHGSPTVPAVGLREGVTIVPTTMSFSPDNLVVSLTPTAPLKSSTLYTVTVIGAPDGPEDENGLKPLDAFVASFVVADTIPPVVVSSSPANSATGVQPDAVVRLTFSEAIASSFALTLKDATGKTVPGQVASTLGDTTAIFTPTDFLKPNTSYTATIANVTDRAGNPLVGGGVFSTQFATVDTLAPVISSLQFPAGARRIAGSSVSVQPVIADTDVARVEYSISGQSPQAATAAPFASSVALPVGTSSVQVSAVAVDFSGNRSSSASLSIPIDANQPPNVRLTSPAGSSAVAQGQTLTFTVSADDDLALSQLLFTVVGAASLSVTHAVPDGLAQFTDTFSFTVPANAASNGQLTVQAAALDSVGNRSVPAALSLHVRDASAPAAFIVTPVNAAKVLVGPLSVSITATDDVGIASVTLGCVPALSGCSTQTLGLPVTSATQTFSVQIPGSTAGAPITFSAFATDTSGNVSPNALRTVQVVDAQPPVVTSLQLVGGGTEVDPGQSFTATARATDNGAVAGISFRAEGAATAAQRIAVLPPASLASASFMFNVPADAPDNSTITLHAQADDLGGNVSVEQILGLTVRRSHVNHTPTANAGPGQDVTVGSRVRLDGSASSDADGNSLTYAWSFTSRPDDSTAALDDPILVTPSFVVDRPGNYVLQLVVNDGVADSASSSVIITIVNSPPIANAGPDQTLPVTTAVRLDGSGSTDVDGDALTFAWSFTSRPTDSAAALSDPTAVRPMFVIDAPGTYILQLIVNDGKVNSAADTVKISTENSAPVARAGADQTVTVGTTVQLDGSGSSDVDRDSLTFAWSFTAIPQGSTAALSDSTAIRPTFIVDRPGTYALQLIARDPTSSSRPSTVTITTRNSAPVANPGPQQTASIGQTVQLDGSGSSDVDGDALTFAWSLTSKPASSLAVLSDATAARPTFVADSRGVYVVQLIVNDGTVNSAPATTTISTENTAPTADAGSAQTVIRGSIVVLDGSRSADADGDPLTYSWLFASLPVGSTATLVDAASSSPRFVADQLGAYVVQLSVSDGVTTSAPATVTVTSVLQPPAVITALDPVVGTQGQTLHVTISGNATHFQQGTTTADFGGGVQVNALTVLNPTQAVADITILNAASLGARTVTLFTGTESAFIVNGFAVLPGVPTITLVNPSAVHQGDSTDVVIAGRFTHFVQGTTIASLGAGITTNSLTVTSATTVTANISVDPAATPGARSITLTTGAEVVSAVDALAVQAGIPVLLSIDPTTSQQGQSLTITVAGRFTSFAQGITTASLGEGVTVGPVTVNSPTSASVPITILDTAALGPRTVTISSGAQVASLLDAFRVLAGTPLITGINPPTARTNSSVVVNLTTRFAHLQSGVTVASLGPNVSVGGAASGSPGPVMVTSPTNVTVNLHVDAGAQLGIRDVTIQTGNEVLTSTGGFTITPGDTTPPRALSIDPSNNATGVGPTTPITVSFTEPLDPATVSSGSFRVSVQNAPIAGTLSFLDGNTVVRFTPASSLPFEAVVVTELTAAITDTSGNPLADQNGNPLVTPVTFTFMTGNFAIVRPPPSTVVENTTITMEAAAGALLNVASVVFTVNGTSLPAVTNAPFVQSFVVPPISTSAQLRIVASARDAQNVEVASAERLFDVLPGLVATPSILGVPRGATRTVRLSLSQAVGQDLPISLSIGTGVATVSSGPIILRAGGTYVDVPVTACGACPGDPVVRVGAAAGNTALIASSSRGSVYAIVSVSDPLPGQQITSPSEPVGFSIVRNARSAGQAIVASGSTSSIGVGALTQPLGGNAALPVSVTSTNPDVATATALAVEPGHQSTILTIRAISNGVTTLTIGAGTDVRTLIVTVGAPQPDQTLVVAAAPVGVAVNANGVSSVGAAIFTAGRQASVSIQMLSQPLAGTTPQFVSTTSSNPAVATATASAVQPGHQSVSVAINALADGVTTLTFTAGSDVRSLKVFVGAVSPDETPMALASPVGAAVTASASSGLMFAPLGTAVSTAFVLFSTPATSQTTVTITSSDPTVVAVDQPSVLVSAGGTAVPLALTTGAGGTAVLTLEGAGERRAITVVVGSDPTPDRSPVVTAMPIGVSVTRAGGSLSVSAPAGVPAFGTLGVQLLATPRTDPLLVTVSSSNPSVVTFGGGAASATLQIPAGSLAVPVTFATDGSAGAAVLTFDFGGMSQQLVFVVGSPSPSQVPAVTSPVIGVRVP